MARSHPPRLVTVLTRRSSTAEIETPLTSLGELEFRHSFGQASDEGGYFLHPFSQLRLGLPRSLRKANLERILQVRDRDPEHLEQTACTLLSHRHSSFKSLPDEHERPRRSVRVTNMIDRDRSQAASRWDCSTILARGRAGHRSTSDRGHFRPRGEGTQEKQSGRRGKHIDTIQARDRGADLRRTQLTVSIGVPATHVKRDLGALVPPFTRPKTPKLASALGGLLGRGRCPRMADYVRRPKAACGAIAAGGASVAFALILSLDSCRSRRNPVRFPYSHVIPKSIPTGFSERLTL